MKTSTIMKRLGAFEKVSNMESSNGNDIANQFVIQFEKGRVFQSYQSIIAVVQEGKVFLGEDWDYSRTTSKYRNAFLGTTTKELEKGIKEGSIKILNK